MAGNKTSAIRNKWFKALVFLVIGVPGILMIWMAVAGPVTVLRVLRYGDTDIWDYQHGPGRELRAASTSFPFGTGTGNFNMSAAPLQTFGYGGDLEAILENNESIAFLVLKQNELLYERYFNGHSVTSISQVFSVSKSITALLVGMAIGDGYLGGTDQSVTDLVPELGGSGWDRVTIRHLLTMTSGSDYEENDNPFGEHVIFNYTPHLVEEILEMGMQDEPGNVFRYKSGDNALLALALSRALGGESITAYAQRRLWDKLGMENGGIWTMDHEGDGLEKSWCCLALSARDLARVGLLLLNNGSWNGEQLVSQSFVHESISAQIPGQEWPERFKKAGWRNYGYNWWLASEGRGDFFALGKDGQWLYVNPSSDVIIVRLGVSSGELSGGQWVSLFQTISDQQNQPLRGSLNK